MSIIRSKANKISDGYCIIGLASSTLIEVARYPDLAALCRAWRHFKEIGGYTAHEIRNGAVRPELDDWELEEC